MMNLDDSSRDVFAVEEGDQSSLFFWWIEEVNARRKVAKKADFIVKIKN